MRIYKPDNNVSQWSIFATYLDMKMMFFGIRTCARFIYSFTKKQFKVLKPTSGARSWYWERIKNMDSPVFWSSSPNLRKNNWANVTKKRKSELKPMCWLNDRLKTLKAPICRLSCVWVQSSAIIDQVLCIQCLQRLFSKVHCLDCICSWLKENNKKSIGFPPVLFGSSSLLDLKKGNCLHFNALS